MKCLCDSEIMLRKDFRKCYIGSKNTLEVLSVTTRIRKCRNCGKILEKKEERTYKALRQPLGEGICPWCKREIPFVVYVRKTETIVQMLVVRTMEYYYCPKCRRKLPCSCVLKFPDLVSKVKWSEEKLKAFCRVPDIIKKAIRNRDIQQLAKEFSALEETKEDALKIIKLLLPPRDYAKFLSQIL